MRTFRSHDHRCPRHRAPRARGALTVARAALGITLAAAWRPAAAQEAVGTVTGKVTASDGGTPLTGATVFVTGAQAGALTRGDGSYRITLRPGRYELRVRFIGWAGVHDSVTVTAGQITTKDFSSPASPKSIWRGEPAYRAGAGAGTS